MRPGYFLCGCAVHHTRQEVLDNPDTFDSQAIDAEGYLICRHHKARQYGWRTDGYAMMRGQDGKSMIRTFNPKIAREQRDLPPLCMPPAQVHLNLLADKADNRDPEEIGNWLMAKTGGFGTDGPVLRSRPGEASDYYDQMTGQDMPPLPDDMDTYENLRRAVDGRGLMQYQRELAILTNS